MKAVPGIALRMRLGWIIFAALAVLTIVEFLVSAFRQATPFLVVAAVIKAWLIIYYFMHVAQLGRARGEGR